MTEKVEMINTQDYIYPLPGRIIIKLENIPMRKTKSGVIYDQTFKKLEHRFGHIYALNEKDYKKNKYRVGDRVVFLKDYAEVISYKNKNQYITFVLLSVQPDGILAIAPEEFTVMDF